MSSPTVSKAGIPLAVPHSLSKGIGLIACAFFCSALMSTFSKEAAHIPPTTILSLQYLISFAFFIPAALRVGPSILQTRHLGLQIFRSLVGSVCQLLVFVAVRSMPLMGAVLLSNAAPLFIPFIVMLWFHKRVQPLVWVSLAIGFMGILLIIKPGPQMVQNPASVVALLAGFFSAVALVSTNKLAETEPPVRILVFNFGTSALLLLPTLFWRWQPLSVRQWTLLGAIGALYAGTQYLIILAYRYADSAELSPFNYTVVIFSGLLGWLFFGDVPSSLAIGGTLLICAGGVLSVQAGHREGQGHPIGTGHWWQHWRVLKKHEAEA